MKESEYIRLLEKGLGSLSAVERQELLQDYRDHFREGKKAGKNEEEISRALGDPGKIARAVAAEYRVSSIEERSGKGRGIGAAIVSIIGLSFFNLVVSLPFFIVLYALVLSLYAVAAAFVASPFILFFFPYLVNLPFDITQLQLLLFSFGLFFIGLAIFFMSGKIWNGVLELTVRFLKWNINVFKGS